MENATKALLIAAAVLIAIILISLGLAVVRQGQEAVQDADLSEAEAIQFNSKFTIYEGENVSTSKANAMLSAVVEHNRQQRMSGTGNFVTVDGARTLAASTNVVTKLDGNNYYSIVCNYEGSLVKSITVQLRPST